MSDQWFCDRCDLPVPVNGECDRCGGVSVHRKPDKGYWTAHCRQVMSKALDELSACTPTPGLIHAKLYAAFESMQVPEPAQAAAKSAWEELKNELLPARWPSMFKRKNQESLF